MIKKLRIKFICIVMAVVTVMLVFILGNIIHFTGSSMRAQSMNVMRNIAGSSMKSDRLERMRKEVSLPFFVVQVGRNGDVQAKGGSYFDLSDEAYVLEVVNAALTADGNSGTLEQYDLRYLKDKAPGGQTIVFTDTRSEQAILRSMVYSSIFIFLAAELVFLGITVILSHWAIKPVETAWNQQRQFVADASHELKTPLTVIMANAELMQQDDTGDADRKTFSQNILTMSYLMRSLVENMLEMARVDNGTLKMQFDAVDFSQLVNDAALSVQLLYEEKELGLRCAVAEGISVHGSEQHLYQVLDVLLDNALKYSSPKGTVSVNLSSNGRSCILAVASPGEPISKEDLKNIFKRFYRADKARTMNGSYGLGLSIAEAIVTAHKGKIWAESKNGYNTFFVQLPSFDPA